MRVRLTWSEMTTGAFFGVRRLVLAFYNERANTKGQDEDKLWQTQCEGACAEMALAKALDRYWSPVGEMFAGDVGRDEVRCTALPHGSLIIHKPDADDRPFYLVVGSYGRFEVKGWMLGADGKRREWWRDDVRNPAYFVPQRALQPFAGVLAREQDPRVVPFARRSR